MPRFETRAVPPPPREQGLTPGLVVVTARVTCKYYRTLRYLVEKYIDSLVYIHREYTSTAVHENKCSRPLHSVLPALSLEDSSRALPLSL